MLREQASSTKCSPTWAKTSTGEAKEPVENGRRQCVGFGWARLEEKDATAAFFPERPDCSKATRLRDGASVFNAELEGIALGLTEIKKKLTKYHTNFVIYSDSLSALKAIQSKNFKVKDIRRLFDLIRKFPPYVHFLLSGFLLTYSRRHPGE
ncbi:hypothetical protein PoB_005092400 [Plakobranchus ocellatus]|uniref:RNase H type-1 domain-containing protein n=1 Tax=Plakobranchus ocellatus TaxID=259542 RepID=A0AAV4C165_9GAST|nr:hypothetical protein PoB_005092400 [Plakobranchus ocellatus]